MKKRRAVRRNTSSNKEQKLDGSDSTTPVEKHTLFLTLPISHQVHHYDADEVDVRWLKEINSKIALGDKLAEILHLKSSDGIAMPIVHALSHIDGTLTAQASKSEIQSQFSNEFQWNQHMVNYSSDDSSIVPPPLKEWRITVGEAIGCAHDQTYMDICLSCGKSIANLTPDQKKVYGAKVSVMHGDNKFQMKQMDARQIDIEHQKKLLSVHKKLVLVLDIDHTLLQAMSYDPVIKAYDFLKQCGDELTSFAEIGGMRLGKNWRHILKLRPHLRQFLEDMSKLCELHIFTHGDRLYADSVAEVLDPTKKLFGDRVISRNEMEEKSKKTLNHIFPAGDQAVMIVDDNLGVWRGHEPNVFHIVPYIPFELHFGITNREVNNQAGGKLSQSEPSKMLDLNLFPKKMKEIDRKESDNQLEVLSSMIKQIHEKFFERYDAGDRSVHVKDLMIQAKSDILKDVHLLFSGIIPLDTDPNTNRLWRLAQRMGAACYTKWRDEVPISHLVIAQRDPNNITDKVKRAEQTPGLFIVHTSWIEECYRYNMRLNEVDYLMITSGVYLPITRHYHVVGEAASSFQEAAQQLMIEMRRAHFKLHEVIEDDFSDLDELSDVSSEEDEASDTAETPLTPAAEEGNSDEEEDGDSGDEFLSLLENAKNKDHTSHHYLQKSTNKSQT